ncbi:hypothetical protein ACWEOI_12925 [Nocardia sp. NPDC004340]
MAVSTVAPVVTAKTAVRRRQQSDVSPPPILRERRYPLDRGLCDNHQIATHTVEMGLLRSRLMSPHPWTKKDLEPRILAALAAYNPDAA